MKGSLDVCLSARPQRAEEMVGVYCFSSCHTITKKQTNTVNYKINCPLCIHLKKGLKGDGDGRMEMELCFYFPFPMAWKLNASCSRKIYRQQCVAVSLKMSFEKVPNVGLRVCFNGATVAHKVELGRSNPAPSNLSLCPWTRQLTLNCWTGSGLHGSSQLLVSERVNQRPLKSDWG